MSKIKKQDALDYHSQGKPGKIEVVPTKPHSSQRDLSLAYSPGVAEPCLEIEKNPEDVYKYTAKGNLVAVITNGTAVLGLENRRALASKQFNINPRIALLSYSNFGSTEGEVPDKIREAVSLLHKNYPELIVDGEMQANFALNNNLLKEQFSFSELVDKKVNTLILPDLASGNIAYTLIKEMGKAEAIGPILLGLKKPVHVLQLGVPSGKL